MNRDELKVALWNKFFRIGDRVELALIDIYSDYLLEEFIKMEDDDFKEIMEETDFGVHNKNFLDSFKSLSTDKQEMIVRLLKEKKFSIIPDKDKLSGYEELTRIDALSEDVMPYYFEVKEEVWHKLEQVCKDEYQESKGVPSIFYYQKDSIYSKVISKIPFEDLEKEYIDYFIDTLNQFQTIYQIKEYSHDFCFDVFQVPEPLRKQLLSYLETATEEQRHEVFELIFVISKVIECNSTLEQIDYCIEPTRPVSLQEIDILISDWEQFDDEMKKFVTSFIRRFTVDRTDKNTLPFITGIMEIAKSKKATKLSYIFDTLIILNISAGKYLSFDEKLAIIQDVSSKPSKNDVLKSLDDLFNKLNFEEQSEYESYIDFGVPISLGQLIDELLFTNTDYYQLPNDMLDKKITQEDCMEIIDYFRSQSEDGMIDLNQTVYCMRRRQKKF